MSGAIETMTELLGSSYDIITSDNEPIVLSAGSGIRPSAFEQEDLTNAMVDTGIAKYDGKQNKQENGERPEKSFDDYVFQVYIGSLTVIGLYAFFRLMNQTR